MFDKEPPRKTLVVSDDPTKVRPIEFAAAISPDAAVVCESVSITPDDLIAQDLETVALIAWHVAIPSEDDPLNTVLNAFVRRGGQLIFFPPKKPANGTFAGVGWGTWQEPQVVRVGSWVGDQDLLTRTRSGDALPVGELRVTRHCDLVGEFRSLAVLDGGAPLIARATTGSRWRILLYHNHVAS